MDSAGGHDGNRQGNRRPPPGTPLSGKHRKRMKGSGSGSEAAAVVAEAEEQQTKEVAGKCSECGKEFFSMKALFGHMRCHPERKWRGIHPPLTTAAAVGGESAVEQEVANSLVLLSGLIPSEAAVGADVVVESSTSTPEDKSNKGKEKVREAEEEKGKQILAVPIMFPESPQASPPPAPPPPPSTNAMVTVFIEEVVSQGQFECSGCKRVFDSHQALGGHRASHKTIKGCYAAGKDVEAGGAGPDRRGRQNPDMEIAEEIRGEEGSMRLERRSGGGIAEGVVAVSSGREYKCCVCSKVFPTGQALGGHMRWHLERNQLFGLAVAAAASSTASSSSQLRWRLEGSTSNPQAGAGSLYSAGKLAPYLSMKQEQQGQGAGNLMNPQAYGSWNLGKDSAAAAGSPSNLPQSSHGSAAGLFLSTTSTIHPWIHPGGEGRQRLGLGGVASPTPMNPQNPRQTMRWLAGERPRGSGGSSSRHPQNPAWLQASGSGEQQQQAAGSGGRDEPNLPAASTHGLPFHGRRDFMHGLDFTISDEQISNLIRRNPNHNVTISSIEDSPAGVWVTPSSANQVFTWGSSRAPPPDALPTPSTAPVRRRPLEEEEGGSSSPSSSPPPSSSSSSSDIDLELRLGR